VRIFLQHHITWSVNSVCHFFGTRRFVVEDQSTNVFWLALPSLGESWHHNHHGFPRSAAHGLRWWELDPSALLIAAMRRLGLAWDVVRIAPERQTQSSRPRRPRAQADGPDAPATRPREPVHGSRVTSKAGPAARVPAEEWWYADPRSACRGNPLRGERDRLWGQFVVVPEVGRQSVLMVQHADAASRSHGLELPAHPWPGHSAAALRAHPRPAASAVHRAGRPGRIRDRTLERRGRRLLRGDSPFMSSHTVAADMHIAAGAGPERPTIRGWLTTRTASDAPARVPARVRAQ
jgi:hypothetical protein